MALVRVAGWWVALGAAAGLLLIESGARRLGRTDWRLPQDPWQQEFVRDHPRLAIAAYLALFALMAVAIFLMNRDLQ